jgi:3-hydroxybenzoate 6-monooxygenase
MERDVASRSDVVIAGGGFAGIGAAIGLASLGLSVTVLERNPQISEIGAGVTMAPNACRALAALGVYAEVKASGNPAKNIVCRDATDGRELTRQNMSSEHEDLYGFPSIAVHRGLLIGLLARRAESLGVTFVTDATVTCSLPAKGGALAVTEGKGAHRGSILVAADGIHSALRRQLSDDDLVDDGYVAYRGTMRAGALGMSLEPDALTMYVAPGGHMTQYPVDGSGSSDDLTISHAVVFRAPSFDQGHAEWGSPDELYETTADWIPELRNVIAMLPKDRHWTMRDREPISNWVDGRMVLAGDAAHPMLQYLGQGAAQALEDALALTDAVSDHVVDAGDSTGWDLALEAYNGRRAQRAARIQTAARFAGSVLHASGHERQLRDSEYRLADRRDFRVLDNLDWLYGGDENGSSNNSRNESP